MNNAVDAMNTNFFIFLFIFFKFLFLQFLADT